MLRKRAVIAGKWRGGRMQGTAVVWSRCSQMQSVDGSALAARRPPTSRAHTMHAHTRAPFPPGVKLDMTTLQRRGSTAGYQMRATALRRLHGKDSIAGPLRLLLWA